MTVGDKRPTVLEHGGARFTIIGGKLVPTQSSRGNAIDATSLEKFGAPGVATHITKFNPALEVGTGVSKQEEALIEA